jgi:hypothetical protein
LIFGILTKGCLFNDGPFLLNAVLLTILLRQHTGQLHKGPPHIGGVKKAGLAGYFVDRKIRLEQHGFCILKMSLYDFIVD